MYKEDDSEKRTLCKAVAAAIEKARSQQCLETVRGSCAARPTRYRYGRAIFEPIDIKREKRATGNYIKSGKGTSVSENNVTNYVLRDEV